MNKKIYDANCALLCTIVEILLPKVLVVEVSELFPCLLVLSGRVKLIEENKEFWH